MKPFFSTYTANRIGKGQSLTSNYIDALLKNKFVVVTSGLEYKLYSPKGKLVFSHIACKDGWKLFLETMPKTLLNLKTILQYMRTDKTHTAHV